MSSNLTPTARTLLAVSAIASVAYLLEPNTFLKGLSVSTLALAALIERRHHLALGLALGSLGDVLLDVGPFVSGLAAFLCSHIVYAVLFLRHRPQPRRALPAAVLLYGVAYGAWLVPHTGSLRVPVIAYLAAILTMVIAALRAGYATHFAAIGALLFLASDSLLAAHRFVTPIPAAGLLIWTTYYLGQCGIYLGARDT